MQTDTKPLNITAGEIAQQILNLAKKRLSVDLRFFSKAFEELCPKEFPEMDDVMATDGKVLYYAPGKLMHAFQMQQQKPAHILLHLILHCILGHPFQKEEKDQSLWNLASDMAVEKVIRQLEILSYSLPEDTDIEQWLSRMEEYCPHMTVQELYNYFLERGFEKEEKEKLLCLFHNDSHFLWNHTENEMKKKGGKADSLDSKEDGETDETTEAEIKKNETDETEEMLNRRSKGRLQKQWQQIAKQIEIDLKTYHNRYGKQAGALMDGLAPITFEECDYSEFLRKFGTINEVMQLSEDEFDMIYYTFGLKKYGNIPLIEPLEFRDDKRIREFVIAIDTSGSVQGEIVQNFLQKTCDVLRQSGSFTAQVKIYLIQCDAQIQYVREINSLDNLGELIENFELYGFGGTDFRPVFDYVNRLLEEKVLTNLNGLLYFTDGAGTYPERQPDYKTAFIFNRDDYVSPKVPYWAMRAVLTSDNIKMLKQTGKGILI